MTDRLNAAITELVEALREAALLEATASPRAPDKLYSIPEACEALGGVGRTFLYNEISAGRLASVRAGRRRLVSGEALRQYIADRAA